MIQLACSIVLIKLKILMNSVRLSSNSQPPFAMFRFSFEWQSKTNEKDDNLMTKMIYTKNYTIRVSKLRLHDVFRIRLQTKKIKHHYSFGSNLSDFFPSKFSFFFSGEILKKYKPPALWFYIVNGRFKRKYDELRIYVMYRLNRWTFCRFMNDDVTVKCLQ